MSLSEDWSLLGTITCACPSLRSFSLRVPVYIEWRLLREEQTNGSRSRPDHRDANVYHTVLSAASRSLHTLSFVLTIRQRPRRRRRRNELIEKVIDLVGLEELDGVWMRERFERLEAVEVVVPESESRRGIGGTEVLEDMLVHALPGLHAAGLLRIVRGP